MKKLEMVVAKFHENIDWLDNMNFSKIIYNKGSNLNPTYVNLNNVGREAHTCLHHIITRWDDLADFTIFTQADPFRHSYNFLNIISSLEKNLEIFNRQFLNFGHHILCEGNIEEYRRHGNFYIEEIHNVFFDNLSNDLICFGAGAIFGVDKSLIKRHDLQVYRDAIDIVSYDHGNKEAHAHAFERLWPTIFCKGIVESINLKPDIII